MRTISITLVALISVAFALPALAQPGQGHGRGGPPGGGPPGGAPPPSYSSTTPHSSGGQGGYVVSDRDRNATYRPETALDADGRFREDTFKRLRDARDNKPIILAE